MSRIRRNQSAEHVARRERFITARRRILAVAERRAATYPAAPNVDDDLPRVDPARAVARMRDEIERLESGEAVEVAGWEVGIADARRYVLDDVGRLTPIEAI